MEALKFWHYFGWGVEAGNIEIFDADRAVLKLKLQRDTILVYNRRINSIIETELLRAREFMSKSDRESARFALRRKKYQEQLRLTATATLDKLQHLTSQLEWSQMEAEIVTGLKEGAAALKALTDALPLEEVEQVMADTAEGIARQREIEEALARALPGVVPDMTAVDAELDAIIEAEARIEAGPVLEAKRVHVECVEPREPEHNDATVVSEAGEADMVTA